MNGTTNDASTRLSALGVQVQKALNNTTFLTWFPSAAVDPVSPGMPKVSQDSNRATEVELAAIIGGIFSDPEVQRVVSLVEEGDFTRLKLVRQLGFRPEGIERLLTEAGEAKTYWRSSILRGETPFEPARMVRADTIDGSRPAHLVSEFHEVYGMPNQVASSNAPTVDYERVHLRMSLIKEEFAELCGAVYGAAAEETLLQMFPTLPDEEIRDVIESADALGDLIYVIYGMALESGIDLDRVVAEVHRSNLSKLMPDGSVLRREDGKILKGPDFSEPRISQAIRKPQSTN